MKNVSLINLSRIKNNALSVKRELDKNCKLCAVVKADAYGHGISAVANELYNVCDYFAVAFLEEARELRLSGIDKDILLLIPPLEREISELVSLNITLPAESITQLKKYNNEGKKQKNLVKVHLAYNTGMNRFGINNISELKKILRYANNLAYIYIEGLFSHFACPENEKIRNAALNKFLLAIKIVKAYNKNIICHISASGGFLCHDADFDMVRIGLLLYGYKPFKSDRVNVEKAMTFLVPVLKNRSLNANERALYGNFKSDKKRKISIIRLGYADGFKRQIVDGQFNNKCMDVSAIDDDISYCYSIKDMEAEAKKYNTITYEMLVCSGLKSEKKYIKI